MKMDKEYFPHVYLECKYTINKIQLSRFISAELDSNSDDDSDNDSGDDFNK